MSTTCASACPGSAQSGLRKKANISIGPKLLQPRARSKSTLILWLAEGAEVCVFLPMFLPIHMSVLFLAVVAPHTQQLSLLPPSFALRSASERCSLWYPVPRTRSLTHTSPTALALHDTVLRHDGARGGVKEQSRLGRLLNGPDADLSPARAQHRRDYPLEPNHRPHLVRERQPSRRAPSVFFRGQQPRHFRPQSVHGFHYSASPWRASIAKPL